MKPRPNQSPTFSQKTSVDCVDLYFLKGRPLMESGLLASGLCNWVSFFKSIGEVQRLVKGVRVSKSRVSFVSNFMSYCQTSFASEAPLWSLTKHDMFWLKIADTSLGSFYILLYPSIYYINLHNVYQMLVVSATTDFPSQQAGWM